MGNPIDEELPQLHKVHVGRKEQHWGDQFQQRRRPVLITIHRVVAMNACMWKAMPI